MGAVNLVADGIVRAAAREAEVGDAWHKGQAVRTWDRGAQQDVARLQVPVQDATVMGMLYAVGQPGDDPRRPAGTARVRYAQRCQRASVPPSQNSETM